MFRPRDLVGVAILVLLVAAIVLPLVLFGPW